MEIEISRIGPENLDRVLSLEKDCFPDSFWGPGTLRGVLSRRPGNISLGALVGDDLAGCVSACADDAGFLHILSVAVAPGFRRRGLATRLLSSALHWGCMKGLRRARLEVRKGSPDVRRVYGSLGFREEGCLDGYYGNGEAAVVMGKAIPGRPEVARTAMALWKFFRGAVPRVGVILGSGLGWLAEQGGARRSIPYDGIPGMEGSGIPGHPGLLSTNSRGTVVFLQGRRHHYQGFRGEEVVLLPSALASIGVDTWLLTTSSGALGPGLRTGDAVVIEDHVNLSGCVPCAPSAPPGKVYSPGLRAEAFRLARTLDAPVSGGIFGCVSGPAYETAAEVALLAGSGVSVVSMSTAQEALALVSQGCRILGVSLVTNEVARGGSVSHSEVLGAQETVSERLGRFLPGLVEELVK